MQIVVFWREQVSPQAKPGMTANKEKAKEAASPRNDYCSELQFLVEEL